METRSTRGARPRSRRPGGEEAWLAEILRGSDQVLLAVRDGVVRLLSRGARDLYGDVEGRPAGELVPPVPEGDGLIVVNPSARELDAFVYGASHDLQEPLRKIIAFGELLEKRAGPALDPGSRDFLQRMRAGANRMTQLIQDLLNLSRSGRDSSRPEAVELGPLLDQLAAKLALPLELGPLPAVRGRAAQLRAAFEQLLANSAKFHGAEPPRVRVTAVPLADGRVELRFSDNGIGFPPEQAERIFEPFTRLHPRHDYPGSGIGLTLARKLLAANGGRIKAEGAPGKGATFVVTLPAAGG